MAKVQQNLPQRPKINMPKIPPILGGKSESPTDDIDKMGDTTTDQCEQKCPCKTPAWVTTAKREIGVKEIKKNSPSPQDNNPRILEYHKAMHRKGTPDPQGGKYGDNIAWCSSFIGWCLKQTGESHNNPPFGLGMSAGAKKFAKSLTPVTGEDRFRLGTIWLIKTRSGHHVSILVGFSKDKKKLLFLGGNQNDMVNEKGFSIDSTEMVGWPPKAKTKITDACWAPIKNNISIGKVNTR